VEVDRKFVSVFPKEGEKLPVWKVKLGESKKLIFDTRAIALQDGDNLLMFAVKNKLVHLARFLVAAGANVRQLNKDGVSAYTLSKMHDMPLNKIGPKLNKPSMYRYRNPLLMCFCCGCSREP
jgi:hypothetical protein